MEYAAASRFHSNGSGILDRPLFAGYDERWAKPTLSVSNFNGLSQSRLRIPAAPRRGFCLQHPPPFSHITSSYAGKGVARYVW
jgi:hypothetical protein